jgi:hypothetical protein
MKLHVIYRCCELETGSKPKRPCRPHWFDKEKLLVNLLEEFKFKQANQICDVEFSAIHDGPTGPLYDILNGYNWINLDKINYNSNEMSLAATLDHAMGVPSIADYIYFVEDDYLHRAGSLNALLSGFQFNSLITLYDHPDRYTRTDDIDYGRTQLFLDHSNSCYWRTAESTTCTWAITQDLFSSHMHNLANKHLLNDRALFRELYRERIRLISPMNGFSTHCHDPFLSPNVNWTI